MAYQRRDPLEENHPGYRGDSPVDTPKYAGAEDENAGYKTGAGEKIKGGYRSNEPGEDKKGMTEFEKQVEEESKGKEQKEDDAPPLFKKVAEEIRPEPD